MKRWTQSLALLALLLPACASSRDVVNATVEDTDQVGLTVRLDPTTLGAEPFVADGIVVRTLSGERVAFTRATMTRVEDQLVVDDALPGSRSFALSDVAFVEVTSDWITSSSAKATASLPGWFKFLQALGRAL